MRASVQVIMVWGDRKQSMSRANRLMVVAEVGRRRTRSGGLRRDPASAEAGSITLGQLPGHRDRQALTASDVARLDPGRAAPARPLVAHRRTNMWPNGGCT